MKRDELPRLADFQKIRVTAEDGTTMEGPFLGYLFGKTGLLLVTVDRMTGGDWPHGGSMPICVASAVEPIEPDCATCGDRRKLDNPEYVAWARRLDQARTTWCAEKPGRKAGHFSLTRIWSELFHEQPDFAFVSCPDCARVAA